MSIYKIFDHGREINRIVADDEFIKEYCQVSGYTYTLDESSDPIPEPVITEQRLAAMESALLSILFKE